MTDSDQPVFPWGHSRRFNDYPTYIKQKFGARIQKISINLGFSCPNRDGTKGTGGCIYCDNKTFRPGYCEPDKSVELQIEHGIGFFSAKYPDMQFLAYFQSYTNTYAPVDELRSFYNQALINPKIKGLIIGTRPDCISEPILDLLSDISTTHPVSVEFGIESTNNATLNEINRCHTWEDSVNAIEQCNARGIETGAHLILGLPGEDTSMMLEHACRISQLPVKTLKLHQLQVIKNTPLAFRYAKDPGYVHLFTMEEYLNLVIRFLEVLNPEIVVERFVSLSPVKKLIAPQWNKIKNFEIVAILEKELEKQNTWQGKFYKEHMAER